MNITPGHILQFYHLKKRIKSKKSLNFCELGSGNGQITKILLDNGYNGICFDLNKDACKNNADLNHKYVKNGYLKIKNQDFLKFDFKKKFDIVISCMVLEHFEEKQVDALLNKFKTILAKDGKIITFVPASKKDWGIEDELFGHVMRYDFDSITSLSSRARLKITHSCGLTYPLSNLLLPISSYIVKKNESSKLNKSKKEQTIISGNRNNRWKTNFPMIFKLLINEIILSPFILLQYLFKNHKRCLVIYFEMKFDKKL